MIGLTFDVEERFHSHLTPPDSPREWRTEERIERILELLVERGRRATFFVVGELAQRYQELVRRMADSGFEVGSHSHTHCRLDTGDRERLRQDITRSTRTLEDITGRPVLGFRAPSWSAERSDDWLWEHLAGLGLRYDSSLFPFRTHRYGSFRNPTAPYRLSEALVEIPPSACELGPLRLPYGGGFYFRLYPAWLTRLLVDRDLRAGKTPIAYFHPWEFDLPERTLEKGIVNTFIGNYRSRGLWSEFAAFVGRYPTAALSDELARLSL